MRRLWNTWFLIGGILVSAQTLAIAAAKPAATAACDPQSCGASCPVSSCGPSCPLPCAGGGAEATAATSMTAE